MENNLKIAITQGDTNGIGLELVLKTFSIPEMFELCTPVLYANEKVLQQHRKALGFGGVQYKLVNSPEQAENGCLNLVPVTVEGAEINVTFGRPDDIAGRMALAAMEAAIADANAGKVDALVTCPINLASMPKEEFPYPSLTDYLSAKIPGDGVMILTNPYMRIAMATNHMPLKDVVEAVTPELIEARIRQSYRSVERDFLCSAPRVAVLGLNPHAGASGLLGSEEEEKIAPVIKNLAETDGIRVFGPYAADGFFGAAMYKHFDSVLAMYHDQGVIPFKALTMTEGVNYTAGLDVVCTAPSHGPAFDRAGKGTADETSFLHAVYAAVDIFRHREVYDNAHANPLPHYAMQHERPAGERRRFPVEQQNNVSGEEQCK